MGVGGDEASWRRECQWTAGENAGPWFTGCAPVAPPHTFPRTAGSPSIAQAEGARCFAAEKPLELAGPAPQSSHHSLGGGGDKGRRGAPCVGDMHGAHGGLTRRARGGSSPGG